jgi:hypothetical protein
MRRMLLMSAVLLLAPRPVVAADSPDLPRLRSSQASLAAILAQADERSATFHQLVKSLARTDGLIFVTTGRCGHGVRACVPHAMTRAGQFRVLRIVIDPHDAEAGGTARVAGTIAHELHHALELLADPAVTDAASMFMFYRRDAPRHGAFETPEAGAVGDRVWQELVGSSGRRDSRQLAMKVPAVGRF